MTRMVYRSMTAPRILAKAQTPLLSTLIARPATTLSRGTPIRDFNASTAAALKKALDQLEEKNEEIEALQEENEKLKERIEELEAENAEDDSVDDEKADIDYKLEQIEDLVKELREQLR